MLRKKLPPSGILGRADPNEILDLIEVKSWLSLAAAVVGRGVGMPKPGLFCAVMGDRAGDCILADEVDVAQVGEMPAQPLHRRLGGAVQFGNQIKKCAQWTFPKTPFSVVAATTTRSR